MEINSHIIKFKGTAYTESDIPRGKTIILAGEWQETKREEISNENGTADMYYHIKPLRILERKDGGEAIPIKVKNRNSVRIRAAIFRAHAELQKEGDSEQFYDRFTDKLCANPEAVINLLGL